MYYWNPQRLKELKAAGYKLHAAPEAKVQASSSKPKPEPSSGSEVSSNKLQAASHKLQAPSRK
jgi:hypothetical protein